MPELYPQLYASEKLFVIPATAPNTRDGKAAKSEVSQKTCQFKKIYSNLREKRSVKGKCNFLFISSGANHF